jgi:hypothetical protein
MMKERNYWFNLDNLSSESSVVLITIIHIALILLNAPIIAARKVFALQDNVCVMKGGLEKIAVSQLNSVVVSQITEFVLILVLKVNMLILTNLADQHVPKDTIKTVKTVQNVTCHALNAMVLNYIIVSLANI